MSGPFWGESMRALPDADLKDVARSGLVDINPYSSHARLVRFLNRKHTIMSSIVFSQQSQKRLDMQSVVGDLQPWVPERYIWPEGPD